MSTASEIRFSDVAQYVGLSLIVHGKRHAKASSRHSTGSLRHQVSQVLSSSPPTSGHVSAERVSAELPPTQLAEVDKMKVQLKMLYAEKRAESEQLKRLHASVSDSALQLERAQRRAQQHQEKHKHHQQRAMDVEQQIMRLQEEMNLVRVKTAESQQRQSRRQSQEPLPLGPGEREELPPQASADDRSRRKGPFRTLSSMPSSQTSTQQPMHQASEQSEAWGSVGLEMEAGQEERGLGRRRSSARARLSAQSARASASGAPADAEPVALTVTDPEGHGALAAKQAHPQSQESRRSRGGSKLSSVEERAASKAPSSAEGHHLDRIPPSRESQLSKRKVSVVMPGEKPPVEPMKKKPEEMNDEDRREALRAHLIAKTGAAKAAFRFLDLSGSGKVSPQEFEDGLRSLQVDLREVCGLARPRDAMKLFDSDKDMNIDFADLFPDEAAGLLGKRVPTPDFCRVYGRSRNQQQRAPGWTPKDQDGELERMFDNSKKNEDAHTRRRWMSATMRRLKGKGKSDARCRELIAAHLPRGTGPKDRDGVSTFTSADLRTVKQVYTDEVYIPVRELSRSIGDLKEQRKEQRRIYDKLYAVTEAELQWERAQAAFSTLGRAKESNARSLASIAQECKMEPIVVEDLFGEFIRFTQADTSLAYKGFVKLLHQLCPNRTLVESDLEAWWQQVISVKPATGTAVDGLELTSGLGANRRSSRSSEQEGQWAADALAKSGGEEPPRAKNCNFEQFALWYASSEARGPDSNVTGVP